MGRKIPIQLDTTCLVCQEPVSLVTMAEGVALFDRESTNRPHACRIEAVIRFTRVWTRASEVLEKARVERGKPS